MLIKKKHLEKDIYDDHLILIINSFFNIQTIILNQLDKLSNFC